MTSSAADHGDFDPEGLAQDIREILRRPLTPEERAKGERLWQEALARHQANPQPERWLVLSKPRPAKPPQPPPPSPPVE